MQKGERDGRERREREIERERMGAREKEREESEQIGQSGRTDGTLISRTMQTLCSALLKTVRLHAALVYGKT